MLVTHIKLQNWRNFQTVDVDLNERNFLVGPNASGKSNLLDVFRFVHDIVKSGGGLQKAVEDRGGLKKIRCLSARTNPEVSIEFTFKDGVQNNTEWKYILMIKNETGGKNRPIVFKEKVWNSKENNIVERPDSNDESDSERLTQTHLQQINMNYKFREIYNFFQTISYLHVIPQIIKYPEYFYSLQVPMEDDSYGFHLLQKIAKTNKRTTKSRLRKIEEALKMAVPQLEKLELVEDRGIPHLEALYQHWRAHGAKQREDQFSDGTLRLIGFLWAILENNSMLLLEEPELSLHSEIVSKLPDLIYRVNKQKDQKQQLLITTHSYELLSDKSIGAEEVLLLKPGEEGTEIVQTSKNENIKLLLEGGMSAADAVLPYTTPEKIEKMDKIGI